MRPPIIKLVSVLNQVKTTRDGGSMVTLECGKDAIDAIVELQRLNSAGDVLLALAITPVYQGASDNELEEFADFDLSGLDAPDKKTTKKKR